MKGAALLLLVVHIAAKFGGEGMEMRVLSSSFEMLELPQPFTT